MYLKMLDRARCYVQRLLYSDHYAIRLLRWMITLGILVASIWFIAQKVYSEYITISASRINLDVEKVLISWLCVTASTLLGAWEWTLLIRALGGHLNPITGMRIHLISGLGKYIPGYIWPYLSKAHLAIRCGVPTSIAIGSVTGELVIIYLSGILLLLVSLPFSGLIGETTGDAQVGITFASGCAIASFLPGVLLDNRFGKFLGFGKAANWKGVIFVIVAVALTWCLLGFGFYMLDASIEPSVGNPWKLLAGLISALLGGQLALFIPMGIGVREAILVAFLNLDKPAWLVILMAVIFRLEMTLGEVFSTLLVVLWSVAKQAHNNPKG
ncbi:MAG: hypothetical protein QXS54_11485 [Candidatus Methanomethylicaceae archaeon]